LRFVKKKGWGKRGIKDFFQIRKGGGEGTERVPPGFTKIWELGDSREHGENREFLWKNEGRYTGRSSLNMGGSKKGGRRKNNVSNNEIVRKRSKKCIKEEKGGFQTLTKKRSVFPEENLKGGKGGTGII